MEMLKYILAIAFGAFVAGGSALIFIDRMITEKILTHKNEEVSRFSTHTNTINALTNDITNNEADLNKLFSHLNSDYIGLNLINAKSLNNKGTTTLNEDIASASAFCGLKQVRLWEDGGYCVIVNKDNRWRLEANRANCEAVCFELGLASIAR